MNTEAQQDRRESDDRRAKPPAIDRRQPSEDKALLVLVQQVHEDVRGINKRLSEHMHDETLALAEAVVALTLKAFPEGDPDGHKAYHEAQMKASEDKAAFWAKMRFELSRAGLLGFLAWAGIQLWNGVLAGTNK
jgi:hypothetical protein